jgi:UDP-hydrolysing UDP-N-acetyl-D-glucosamine 2-epimerase
MAAPRKICVMTGTRAEYGLLYWLMRELQAAPDVRLQVVVSAMHLAAEFGHTVSAIRADGFTIDAEVPCLASGDDAIAMGQSTARALDGFVNAFAGLAPDVLVLLGDRFEVLAAAIAATMHRIPIAHIHGGEITAGAMDDAFRHAVTKMAHLHFVAAPDYARRVVQLGETPDRVHVSGALGLENLVRLALPAPGELARHVDLDLAGGYFLVTYHPATLEAGDPVEGLNELLSALEHFPGKKLIITKANADAGGRRINRRLESFAAAAPVRAHLADSLGQANYLAALKGADAVIGNSSSGIIEAPAVDVPTVNIGTRQAGRLRARSIIDCEPRRDAIVTAIETAMSPEFRGGLAGGAPPYGRPASASGKIAVTLRQVDLRTLRIKRFYDIHEAGGS